ncbi:hypothetical protein VMCG_03583 [Cytospora schulzeri]|uniref:Ecp2 effector protein domain-containing protein n=1 Tax=Cytospora schulzeri TaxID=448051 RepID=A0A423WW42_9PEZI|nr:hypothetical protein VMCG_03583 [Valsa malicola]
MQLTKHLLTVVIFMGAALGGLIVSATATDAVPSLVPPSQNITGTTNTPSSEEVNIEWYISVNPPAQICTPYAVSYRDDNCYPQIADCQHIYNQYVDFSNSFCLTEPSGIIDFGTLITYNTCMIQVSLVDNNLTCAAAPDIADKINAVLKSPYKSPDGKGVWTSFGNMKCPNGHKIGPINWMEWYMGCAA